MRTIIDAHLDLAWNVTSYNRDLTLGVDEIRAAESGLDDCHSRRNNVVSLPELKASGVAVCIVTLLARSGPQHRKTRPIKRIDLDYTSPHLAHCAVHAQIEWYRQMTRAGFLQPILTRGDLHKHVDDSKKNPGRVGVGFILSMECADPILLPDDLPDWHAQGLRAIGPAHYGQGRYAGGTGSEKPFSEDGRRLMKAMSELGMALDVTHLSDAAVDEALEHYDSPLLASHHNCRALADSQRQLPDAQIKRLIDRGGVIGAVFHEPMLVPISRPPDDKPLRRATIHDVADHIDHVCQIAGNVHHSAIGSDLDGGFGWKKAPEGIEKYRDVQKLAAELESRGYSNPDIDAIFYGNWLRFLGELLLDA